MNTYIVSTSYGQYIEAVSDYMELPFKNTFYTKVNLDSLTLTSEEIEKIMEFKELILSNPEDYELFDDIFFSQIVRMGIYGEIEKIEVSADKAKSWLLTRLLQEMALMSMKFSILGIA
jgi:Uncharacterized protein conserved in archaea